jgi:molybdopterin-containing oxidoreductase family iron-sulfur binding subunit
MTGDESTSDQPAVPFSDVDSTDEFGDPEAFDQDLGRRMGEDAQRLADGELTEAEFYEKYHDAIVEEFGEDKRPVSSESDE